MKKCLLFLSTLLICKAVFAEAKNLTTLENLSTTMNTTELATDSSRTYADELLAGYEKARAYNLDAVPAKTLIIGRCFEYHSPNVPVASALLIDAWSDNAGPIEGKPKKALASVWDLGAGPSFYDDKTYAQLVNYPYIASAFAFYQHDPASNALKRTLPGSNNESFSLLRNDTKYVYQKLVRTSLPNVYTICYYFKTVQ